MTKIVCKQKYFSFSFITTNSNWEILPKNLVTFKRSDGIKDEKLYFGSTLKNLTFGGSSQKTNIEGEGGVA